MAVCPVIQSSNIFEDLHNGWSGSKAAKNGVWLEGMNNLAVTLRYTRLGQVGGNPVNGALFVATSRHFFPGLPGFH